MYYWILLEGYQIKCVGSFSFARATSFRKYKPVNIQCSQDHRKRKSGDKWNSEITQNLNIYLYNYQTEAQSMKKQLWHAVI